MKFSIPEAGFVKGVVYDILGREVTTLLNGEMNSGYHEVKFDAVGLSSGVYIFRLESGKYSSAIKMIVNK
ncbi:MAG: T9SS type A sorting domain-containing protein [Ignavibacteriales bacterium]|nr:T9SS type A sorting domain-containing protein [Ignavibacteriales bacterium]